MDSKPSTPIIKGLFTEGRAASQIDSCCSFPSLYGRPLVPTLVQAKRGVGYQKLQTREVYKPKVNHLSTFQWTFSTPQAVLSEARSGILIQYPQQVPE